MLNPDAASLQPLSPPTFIYWTEEKPIVVPQPQEPLFVLQPPAASRSKQKRLLHRAKLRLRDQQTELNSQMAPSLFYGVFRSANRYTTFARAFGTGPKLVPTSDGKELDLTLLEPKDLPKPALFLTSISSSQQKEKKGILYLQFKTRDDQSTAWKKRKQLSQLNLRQVKLRRKRGKGFSKWLGEAIELEAIKEVLLPNQLIVDGLCTIQVTFQLGQEPDADTFVMIALDLPLIVTSSSYDLKGRQFLFLTFTSLSDVKEALRIMEHHSFNSRILRHPKVMANFGSLRALFNHMFVDVWCDAGYSEGEISHCRVTLISSIFTCSHSATLPNPGPLHLLPPGPRP